MIWIYLLVGITLTFGGCYCCLQGCVHCTDGTNVSSIQIDVIGPAADQDTAGCCDTLAVSHGLTITGNKCIYSMSYLNGYCQTTACEACDDTGCAITCLEGLFTPCEPGGDPTIWCNHNADITWDANCTACADTEMAEVSDEVSANVPGLCDCDCVISALLWDVDLMIVDYPLATWAVANDPIYLCDCIPVADCTATVGQSNISFTVTIGTTGSDANITVSGIYMNRNFSGGYTFSGDPVSCATEMNALALTVGPTGSGDDVEITPCAYGNCLCVDPTSFEVTFIP